MMKNCEHKVVKEAVYIFVVHTHNEALLQNAVLIFQKHLNEGESKLDGSLKRKLCSEAAQQLWRKITSICRVVVEI
jgi:hypothetical protein